MSAITLAGMAMPAGAEEEDGIWVGWGTVRGGGSLLVAGISVGWWAPSPREALTARACAVPRWWAFPEVGPFPPKPPKKVLRRSWYLEGAENATVPGRGLLLRVATGPLDRLWPLPGYPCFRGSAAAISNQSTISGNVRASLPTPGLGWAGSIVDHWCGTPDVLRQFTKWKPSESGTKAESENACADVRRSRDLLSEVCFRIGMLYLSCSLLLAVLHQQDPPSCIR